MADLQGIRGYYKARINDLTLFSKYGTPWDFVSGAMLIEWIANLTKPEKISFAPPKMERPYFVDFIQLWAPKYANFEFQTKLVDLDNTTKTTGFYLPLQLYLTLRNPLVHSFSLIPTDKDRTYVPPAEIKSYKQLGRPSCLVLGHKPSGEKISSGEHLALVKPDRCFLRSPDFIEDIDEMIEACFTSIEQDDTLQTLVVDRFQKRRPVDSIGQVEIIRKGP